MDKNKVWFHMICMCHWEVNFCGLTAPQRWPWRAIGKENLSLGRTCQCCLKIKMFRDPASLVMVYGNWIIWMVRDLEGKKDWRTHVKKDWREVCELNSWNGHTIWAYVGPIYWFSKGHVLRRSCWKKNETRWPVLWRSVSLFPQSDRLFPHD